MSTFNHPTSDDTYSAARARMVRTQLADRDIRDSRVLQAMLDVPRHEFVAEELRSQAYDDHPLPIGFDQTISQPYIVALMLQYLELKSTDCALEVGTGSGYATALLSRLCAEVFSIERYPVLAESAMLVLGRLGYSNARVVTGDGSEGLPERSPFDAIIVSAAASDVPNALLEQLAEGGRMIVPIGTSFSQQLQLIRKSSGQLKIEQFEGCRFVPLVSDTQV